MEVETLSGILRTMNGVDIEAPLFIHQYVTSERGFDAGTAHNGEKDGRLFYWGDEAAFNRMMDALGKGDQVYLERLVHLGRTAKEIHQRADLIHQKGAHIRTGDGFWTHTEYPMRAMTMEVIRVLGEV